MVELSGLSYKDTLIRFRRLRPMQQAAIVGAIFFVLYIPYSHFLLRLSLQESVSMSVFSSIIFMAVYYFTSILINRKAVQAAGQSRGPKKGLRNK